MRIEGQTMEGRATSSGLDSSVTTKAAIVTGAPRGIGLGIAERLLEMGYCVVANSRNITLAKTLQPGNRLKLVDGDIGRQNVAKQVVDSAKTGGTVAIPGNVRHALRNASSKPATTLTVTKAELY